jgi:hypothetical protein
MFATCTALTKTALDRGAPRSRKRCRSPAGVRIDRTDRCSVPTLADADVVLETVPPKDDMKTARIAIGQIYLADRRSVLAVTRT